MQWNDGRNAGFTDGTPWFALNPNYTVINAENALEDKNSVFYYYQKLISLRKEYQVFLDGSFTLLLPEDEKIFAYVRKNEDSELLVCVNFTDEELSLPEACKWHDGELLIHNYDGELGSELRPYEAFMVYRAVK